jgi:outer membrane lipoprotein-sorting protein
MTIKSIALTLFVALSTAALAADKEVEELLSKMRDAYKGTKSVRMTTAVTSYFEEEKFESTFEISFKNPNKVRMTTDKLFGMEGQIKIISDGKTITVITPEEKDEVPYSIEAMSDGAPVNLETLCLWDWKRQLSTEAEGNMHKSELKLVKEQKWNDKEWIVLEESAPTQKVFVRYWIDPKTHFIWRTEVMTLEGRDKLQECIVKKLDTELTLEDSVFDGP